MSQLQPEAGGSRPPEARLDKEPVLSFRVKVILVWIAIFALLTVFVSLAKFDWSWIRGNAAFILKAVWITILMAGLSIILAVFLAVLGSLGRLSRNSIAYGVSGFYTSFFRGTPLIVQLFLVYFALPQVAQGLGLAASHPAIYQLTILSVPFTGVLVLGLNYGAYMTEIFRAGILSVGPGQTEAADALGMTFGQRMRRVVLPQAFKVVIPPTANEFIAMTKDTALVGFLGGTLFWMDPFTRARTLGALSSRPLEALIIAAGMYWAMTIILTFFQTKLERRVNKAYVRTGTGAAPGGPGAGRRIKFVVASSAGGSSSGAMMTPLGDPQPAFDIEHAERAALIDESSDE